jgi:hypothetical protein
LSETAEPSASLGMTKGGQRFHQQQLPKDGKSRRLSSADAPSCSSFSHYPIPDESDALPFVIPSEAEGSAVSLNR